MAKNKDESQENVTQKKVEDQMNNTKKVIQNSAVARKLPKKVKNMGTKDLLKFSALIKFAYFFPTFIACDLVSNSKSENFIIKSLSTLATWICYITFVDFANYFIYFTELIDLFIVCYVATIIKTGIAMLYIFAIFFALKGIVAKIAVLFFALSTLYVDTVFLLYLDIYFKEIRGEKAGEQNI
ncbi:hypothetical protein EHP00_1744 [Ecytonucleospora hepatopenaei]|uniref:Uncharacterized protein n=1 Tax=Ecytonucleospora hepatopenaei TaxID=646526 RepID=A0A1W0E424_9MICR|nr:hypothetical protein EHP00_1744 [Ecytonucleospora hepatopenaei]